MASLDAKDDELELVEMKESCYESDDLPAVFQCGECDIVLGDTSSFLWSSKTMDALALENINPAAVKIQGEVHTSTEGFDKGSTYMLMKCKRCRKTLGTYYMATTKAVDHLREKYTLDASSINRYVLGTFGGRHPCESSINLSSEIMQLRKVQGIAVHLETRLKRVEAILNISHTDDEETQNNELSTTFGKPEKNTSNVRNDRSFENKAEVKDEIAREHGSVKRKNEREYKERKKKPRP